MKHSRLSPDAKMPQLDAVTAIPYGDEIVGLFLDGQGRHYRALLNGSVLEGDHILEAVAVNAALVPQTFEHAGGVSDQQAGMSQLKSLYRDQFGVPVSGRPSNAEMYKAQDGVNRGVRPLK